MPRLRLPLLSLLVSLLISVSAPAVLAQSVESVVDDMKATQQKQFETVDTYIVETNRYTSYHKKISKDGAPAYKTDTRMKNGSESILEEVEPLSSASSLHLDRLKKHATYDGLKTVNEVECHVLRVEKVSEIHPNAGHEVRRATYYIDAAQSLPARIVMEMKGPQSKDHKTIVNLKNYQTTDGLTLPHRMEIDFKLSMSEQERQELIQMMEKIENLSEQKRKRMQKTMNGEVLEVMKQMTSDGPMGVEVQNVTVNATLPDDVF